MQNNYGNNTDTTNAYKYVATTSVQVSVRVCVCVRATCYIYISSQIIIAKSVNATVIATVAIATDLCGNNNTVLVATATQNHNRK